MVQSKVAANVQQGEALDDEDYEVNELDDACKHMFF